MEVSIGFSNYYEIANCHLNFPTFFYQMYNTCQLFIDNVTTEVLIDV